MKLVDFTKFTKHLKDNGIIKELDNVGRIVIPIKFRTVKVVYLQRIEDYLILSPINEDGSAFEVNYDDLGRIVIPIEIRKDLDLQNKAPLSVWTYKDNVILKKYEEKCVFCKSKKHLVKFKEKLICNKCKEQIAGA